MKDLVCGMCFQRYPDTQKFQEHLRIHSDRQILEQLIVEKAIEDRARMILATPSKPTDVPDGAEYFDATTQKHMIKNNGKWIERIEKK